MTSSTPAIQSKSVYSSDGVKLQYDDIGTGDPLLMLHGVFTGRAVFSRQHELADQWRLILPSARAHDGTDGRLPAGYGIATTELDDVLAILKAEGLERFNLLGHSSGGAVAFALARRFPERVKRLILIEPTLVRLLKSSELEVTAGEFSALADIGEKQGSRAGMRSVMEWLGGDAWRTLDETKKSARLEAMAPMEHLVAPHLRALVDFAISEEDVRALTMPTLLIYGSASYPMEDQILAQFREIRPDWPQVLVEGAGHNSFREQPKIVNAAIRRFLSA